MGMGMVDKSYIWIASENSNDVSKVDTQCVPQPLRQRDPAGLVPLRRALLAAPDPIGDDERAARSVVQVDVAPAKPEDLAVAHPAVYPQQGREVELVAEVLGHRDEPLSLLRGEMRLVLVVLLEPLDLGHRRDQPPLRCDVQHRGQLVEHAVERALGEAGPGPLDELKLRRPDLIDRQLPQQRHQMAAVRHQPGLERRGALPVGDDIVVDPPDGVVLEQRRRRLGLLLSRFLLVDGRAGTREEGPGLLARPSLGRRPRGHRRAPTPPDLLAVHEHRHVRLPVVPALVGPYDQLW
jgi:hypothetical protein